MHRSAYRSTASTCRVLSQCIVCIGAHPLLYCFAPFVSLLHPPYVFARSCGGHYAKFVDVRSPANVVCSLLAAPFAVRLPRTIRQRAEVVGQLRSMRDAQHAVWSSRTRKGVDDAAPLVNASARSCFMLLPTLACKQALHLCCVRAESAESPAVPRPRPRRRRRRTRTARADSAGESGPHSHTGRLCGPARGETKCRRRRWACKWADVVVLGGWRSKVYRVGCCSSAQPRSSNMRAGCRVGCVQRVSCREVCPHLAEPPSWHSVSSLAAAHASQLTTRQTLLSGSAATNCSASPPCRRSAETNGWGAALGFGVTR